MSLIPIRSLVKNKGIIRGSYYDMRKPYTQKELDEYRIREGYSKELRIRFTKKTNTND